LNFWVESLKSNFLDQRREYDKELKKLATLKVIVHGLQQEVVVCGGLNLFTNTISSNREAKKGGVQKYLINSCSIRVLEGEKDCETTCQKSVSVSSKLEILDHQVTHGIEILVHQATPSKSWIQGLLNQVYLMSYGSGVSISPFSMGILHLLTSPACYFYPTSAKDLKRISAKVWT
jgi:hypothetical protein